MNNHLTEGEIVVLGLLAERPRHGYDLEQTVRERGIREWTSLGFSSLYYLLEKLETKGLIRLQKPAQQSTKRVFTITPDGEHACRQAVAALLSDLQPQHTAFLVALANSPLLTDVEVRDHLALREQHITEKLAVLAVTLQRQQPVPDFVDQMFDYSISLLQAEREWLHKTAAQMHTMEKIDFKKELKTLYNPPKEFVQVVVPPMRYLMIDGHGDPNMTASYKEAVEALFSVAYTLKFASKKQLGKDYGVMPLEGLWTSQNMDDFITRNKDNWDWTMMIMQPEWITPDMVRDAIAAVRAKKNPPALEHLRFETYDEGTCVQIMHVGSYDDETPTLQKLHHGYMPENGLVFNGSHHEIYIGDPRKADPSKLKTILRQPVRLA
jgi:DNA-binding PadR family transcriptional regulator